MYVHIYILDMHYEIQIYPIFNIFFQFFFEIIQCQKLGGRTDILDFHKIENSGGV